MSNLFSKLEEMERQQKQQLESQTVPQDAQKNEQESEQTFEQETAYLSKPLSNRSIKSMSKSLSICIEPEDVETLAFELRKSSKSKVNTELPTKWKLELDHLAMELGVGKYDLIAYILASYLGHTKNKPI